MHTIRQTVLITDIIINCTVFIFIELRRLRGVSTSLLVEDVKLLREEARVNELAMLSGDRDWGMGRVLRDPRLRLPLILTCSMQAGQQFSGINAVSYFL